MAVQQTRRYEQLQQALRSHAEVTHLVGHSLGAAAIREAARQRPELTTTSYGAPVIDVFAKSTQSVGNRFSTFGDPTAFLDTNATPGVNLGNPHSFSNFANIPATDSSRGYTRTPTAV